MKSKEHRQNIAYMLYTNPFWAIRLGFLHYEWKLIYTLKVGWFGQITSVTQILNAVKTDFHHCSCIYTYLTKYKIIWKGLWLFLEIYTENANFDLNLPHLPRSIKYVKAVFNKFCFLICKYLTKWETEQK